MKERWTGTRIQKLWVGRFFIRALGCADCGKVQIITPNFAKTSTGSGTRESAASDICKDEAFPTQLQPGVRAPQVALITVAHTKRPQCSQSVAETIRNRLQRKVRQGWCQSVVLSLSAIIDLDPVGLTHWKVVVIGRCGHTHFSKMP